MHLQIRYMKIKEHVDIVISLDKIRHGIFIFTCLCIERETQTNS